MSTPNIPSTPLYKLTLLFLLLIGCSEQTTRPVLQIPEGKVGIFGYGSLMDRSSMELTLGGSFKDSIYQVHLDGYNRKWNFTRAFDDPAFLEVTPEARLYDHFYIKNGDTLPLERILGLNIVEKPGSSMNGILYILSPEDLEKLDRREIGYERIEVQDSIREFLIEGGEVFAYKASSQNIYTPTSSITPVLVAHYRDMVIRASEGLGNKFSSEFNNSTLPIEPNIIIADTLYREEKEGNNLD